MILVLLLVIGGVKAQTVDIHDVTASPGNVLVQVDMMSFPNVSAITLEIYYNPDLMSFTQITNMTLSGTWQANATTDGNGVPYIAITYYDSPPLSGNSINGKLLDLSFNYYGGFADDLTFGTGCEITNVLNPISGIVYTNGSISNSTSYDIITGFMPTSADVGELVIWPLLIAGIEDVNSMTLHLTYDPVILTYNGFQNPTLTGFVVSGGAGTLDITWSSIVPAVFTGLSPLMDLKFTYNGGGATDLSFLPGSMMSMGTTPLNIGFADGTINVDPGSFVGSITISQIISPSGTSNIEVPVVANGLSAVSTGAISLKMAFDPALLTYKGYTADQFSGWVVTQAPAGTLNFIKTSTAALTITDADLVTLKFDRLSNTDAAINFIGGSFVQTNEFVYVPVDFNDGSIGTNSLTVTSDANGTLGGSYNGVYPFGDVVAIEGIANTGYQFDNWTGTGAAYVADVNDPTTTVTIPPITIALQANFVPDLTQFFDLSLVLGTNGASVSGDGSYNVEDNVIITAVPATGYYFVEWTGDISYITTGTATDASVTITMPAQNIELTAVFAGYSVSGMLKYANPTGAARPITNSTVYLKTSDGLTVLQTTTSDASGNFTFSDVPDGSYKVDGATAKAWGGLTLADYAIVRNFVNVGTPVLAGIYWQAADVNLSNTVTLADYAIIRNRVNTSSTAGWTAPNWLIPQVSVTVSGANVTGVNVLGICSGDVNTSYTPPL